MSATATSLQCRSSSTDPWDHEEVQDDVQHYFNSELVPTAASSPIGVVGGLSNESGFTKKGNHTQASHDSTTVAWPRRTTAKSVFSSQG